MADTTYSVRIDEETKEKIGELVKKSGLNSKDFMTDLLQTYEINKTKEVVPLIEKDLDELQILTRRINSIYINVGERIDLISKDKDEQYKDLLAKKDNLIYTLQTKIQGIEELNSIMNSDVQRLENELKDSKEENLNLENKYSQDINTYTEVNASNKALIQEYKNKIESLNKVIEENRQYKSAADKSQQELLNITTEMNSFKNINIELTKEIEQLNSTLESLKTKSKEDLSELKEKLNFEKEKALLVLEKNHQDSIQKLHDEYNLKVKALLDEMESSRKRKPKATTSTTK